MPNKQKYKLYMNVSENKVYLMFAEYDNESNGHNVYTYEKEKAKVYTGAKKALQDAERYNMFLEEVS